MNNIDKLNKAINKPNKIFREIIKTQRYNEYKDTTKIIKFLNKVEEMLITLIREIS